MESRSRTSRNGITDRKGKCFHSYIFCDPTWPSCRSGVDAAHFVFLIFVPHILVRHIYSDVIIRHRFWEFLKCDVDSENFSDRRSLIICVMTAILRIRRKIWESDDDSERTSGEGNLRICVVTTILRCGSAHVS
jgi:hypothetical protein